MLEFYSTHDDVINWKHFPRYWTFVRGIHRSSVNSPHKGQSRGALMFSLICAQINGWINNRDASDLRRHRAHYEVIVMQSVSLCFEATPRISCDFEHSDCPDFSQDPSDQEDWHRLKAKQDSVVKRDHSIGSGKCAHQSIKLDKLFNPYVQGFTMQTLCV